MSFVVKVINNEALAEWDRFICEHSYASFHQSNVWSGFQNALHWDNIILGLYESGVLIGGANVYQFTFPNKTNFLYVPGGPVLSYDNEDLLFEQWRALMPEIVDMINKDGCITSHLRIEPLLDYLPDWFLSGFEKASFNLLPSSTQFIDLRKDTDFILADMKQKGRYNLKQARKKGVQVELVGNVTDDDVEDFYKLYEDTFKRNDFYGKGIEFFKHFFDNCAGISQLFFAKIDGERVAASVLVFYGEKATYLYGASSTAARGCNAPYLLQWEMMQYAKGNGCDLYDLWGVAPSLDMLDHAWHGMTRFKKQLGGYQVDRIGAYDSVFNKAAYKAFVDKYES